MLCFHVLARNPQDRLYAIRVGYGRDSHILYPVSALLEFLGDFPFKSPGSTQSFRVLFSATRRCNDDDCVYYDCSREMM